MMSPLVQADIIDRAGNLVAYALPEVRFTITGPGELVAIDNGAPFNHVFRGNQISAGYGKCTAYVRATADAGVITVTANGGSLASGSVTLQAQPPTSR